jgi:ABC-type sugar transport system substrate-binding protein
MANATAMRRLLWAAALLAFVGGGCRRVASTGSAKRMAEKAAIPVFTVDIAARSGRVVSHVASDNVQGGRLAAQALARYLGDTAR